MTMRRRIMVRKRSRMKMMTKTIVIVTVEHDTTDRPHVRHHCSHLLYTVTGTA